MFNFRRLRKSDAMLEFVEMTTGEATHYCERIVGSYAQEIAAAQRISQAEAESLARGHLRMILSSEPSAIGNRFYHIVSDGRTVGAVWLKKELSMLFIVDIVIFPPERRHGHATKALNLIEEQARALGCSSVMLCVFSHNTLAIRLYNKAGFRVTGMQMVRGL